MTSGSSTNTFEVATDFVRALGVECHYLTAPIYCANRESRDAILLSDELTDVLARTEIADIGLVSCGALTSETSHHQLVAGYAAYGPQTSLVLTIGKGVQIFTLDGDGIYRMTADDLKVAPETSEFAINAARRFSWDDTIVGYVDRAIEGGHNMRWVGSMVADTHRIFNRGGIFLYPADRNKPSSGGRLRLL